MAFRFTKYTKIILGFALAAAVWLGCRKDVDLFIESPTTVSDVAALLESLAQNDAPPTVFDLKGSDHDTIFTTSNGLRILIRDRDALFADATTGADIACSTCAEARLEVIAAFSKSQMLARRLSSTANGQMLDVFGAVRLRATCDGKELRLRDGKKIALQTPFSDAAQSPVQLFFGQKNAKNQHFWTISGNSEGVLASAWLANNESQVGYEWQIDRLGWVGAAALSPNVSGLACVKLASPQTTQNSMVFAVLKNQKSIVEFSATATPYQMCAPALADGEEIEIVIVSNIDGKWSLGRLETTVQTNTVIDLSGIASPTTEADLAAALRSL